MYRMFKKIRLIVVFCFGASITVSYANPFKESPLHAGLSVGLAYPQIPISEFRPPIGLTGNTKLIFNMHPKWAIQGGINGMKTFSLGTVTGHKAPLKFDVIWFNIDLQYALSKDFNKSNYVSAGSGIYKLNRQLDQVIDRVRTPGIRLGFINHSFHQKYRAIFEIYWHLLFKPDDNPQILTMTFGFLL